MAAYYGGYERKYYSLKSDSLGKGGEGAVYLIDGDDKHVAKIYHDTKFPNEAARQALYRKIKTMVYMDGVKSNSFVDGKLKIAWPQDILFDSNDRFVGYIMPRVQSKYKIFHIQRDKEEVKKVIPDFNWKYAIQYAYNLSWVVYFLHLNNIVIGDMNMNNIVIDTSDGNVTLIDCDSFDIKNYNNNDHFKCEVGMPELLAPELQMVGRIKDGTFTKESDDFSLGIHLFRLLMMNADPFCAKVVGHNVDSQTANNTNFAILNGECPYFRPLPNKKVPDWAPPLSILPPAIATAFNNTFNYTQTTVRQSIKRRTTAEQWNALLLEYAKYGSPNLVTCSRDSKHIYSSHLSKCPFCS